MRPDDDVSMLPNEEEAALLAELAEAESQLLAADARDVVANHCYGLFQLAALHLGQQPPHLDESRLAIDAFAALVDGLGDRLGQSAGTLRDGLAQIRLAYVQISAVVSAEGAEAPVDSAVPTGDAPTAPEAPASPDGSTAE